MLWNLLATLARLAPALRFEEKAKLVIAAVCLQGNSAFESERREAARALAAGRAAGAERSEVAKQLQAVEDQVEVDKKKKDETFAQRSVSVAELTERFGVTPIAVVRHESFAKFGLDNFGYFRAMAELLPIHHLVEEGEGSPLWQCLQKFTGAGEELQQRLCALSVASCRSGHRRGNRAGCNNVRTNTGTRQFQCKRTHKSVQCCL